LQRFYDPQSGQVLVDGVDIRDADPAEVRGRIAVVPQDVTIFAASVADNIGFSRPGASGGTSRRPPDPPMRANSSKSCRKAMRRPSANAASRFQADSANASR
jgi:ABC-type cobalamin/Fe3+-siderophores transport system ATPase subunit